MPRLRELLDAGRPSKFFDALLSVDEVVAENAVLRSRVTELGEALAESRERTRRWVAKADAEKARADRCSCAAMTRTGW